MISVLIHIDEAADPDAIERLADTLGGLVAGVAAGLVADAVIVARTTSPALETVAEATGARLVAADGADTLWQAGARAARRDWVLCLEAGDLPREGWIRVLDRFVNTARPDVGHGRLRRPAAGPGPWISAGLERLFGTRSARAGDVVRRVRLVGPGRAARLVPRAVPARIDRA